MEILKVESMYEQWFAKMADRGVDGRKCAAHFHLRFGLGTAVTEVLEVLQRHPSLVTEAFIDNNILQYCQWILDSYSIFAPEFCHMFDF